MFRILDSGFASSEFKEFKGVKGVKMTIQLLVFCFVQKLTTLLPNILCFMKVNSFLLLNICLLCLQKRSFVVR
jgi:hypothetical protein